MMFGVNAPKFRLGRNPDPLGESTSNMTAKTWGNPRKTFASKKNS